MANDSICSIFFEDFLCIRHNHIMATKMDFFFLSLQSVQLSGGDKQVARQYPKDGTFCDGRKEKCVREGLLEKVSSKLDQH